MESLGAGCYLVATQDCLLSKVQVSASALTTEPLDLVAPSPITCLRVTPEKVVYVACELGTLLVLSLPSTLLYQWSADPQVTQIVPMSSTHILLSSLTRACIVHIQTGGSTQVGSKERKGDLGACCYKDLIIAARPNGFLWKANFDDGKVISTLKLSTDEGGKLAYGWLYSWRNLILSYRAEERELLLLDLEAGKLLQSMLFLHKTALYKSPVGDDVYRLTSKDGLFLLRQLSTKEAFQLYVQKRSLTAALELVHTNACLWDLETLQGLCEQVLGPASPVQGEQMERFMELVGKLELQSPLEIHIHIRKLEPDQAFLSRFSSYRAHQRRLKDLQTASLALRTAHRKDRLEAAQFLGLPSWSHIRSYWKVWLQAKTPLKLLFQGLKRLKNPKIRLILQANLQVHGEYMGVMIKNRGVERLRRVRLEIGRYREYLKVAKRAYDWETYTEVREMMVLLGLLQYKIL